MGRNFLFSSILAFGMAFGVAVQPAEASDELNSSMIATCVGAGGSCNMIDFVLDVEGQMFMKDLAIFGNDTWRFSSVDQVWSQGNPVSWNATVGSAGISVLASSGDVTFDPEPLRVRVSMSSWGSASQLTQIAYTANGYAVANPTASQISSGSAGFFSTQGNVVPEPITTVLLGTGLAGLAGVGARRKKESVEEGEDAA